MVDIDDRLRHTAQPGQPAPPPATAGTHPHPDPNTHRDFWFRPDPATQQPDSRAPHPDSTAPHADQPQTAAPHAAQPHAAARPDKPHATAPGTAQPQTAAQHPAQPNSAARPPVSTAGPAAHSPHSAAPRAPGSAPLTEAERQAATAAWRAALATQQLNAAAQHQHSAGQQPETVGGSGLADQLHNTTTPQAWPAADQPGSAARQPDATAREPGGSVQPPGTTAQRPDTDVWQPDTGQSPRTARPLDPTAARADSMTERAVADSSRPLSPPVEQSVSAARGSGSNLDQGVPPGREAGRDEVAARIVEAVRVSGVGDEADSGASELWQPAPAGSPTESVPLRGGQGRLVRAAVPSVLVLGGSGSSGATTTALGLAAAAAVDSDGEIWPVVVDATLGGGDVALRGCDAAAPVSTMQKWLQTAHPGLASSVGACSGQTSTGVRVLARTPDPLPRRESLVSVARHLETAGLLGVFDAGAPVTSRLAAPLLSDPRVGLVITVAARPDAINRLQPALGWLDENFSEFVVGDAVIVLTEQVPGSAAAVVDHVRTHLGSWVRDVVQIPFDIHLASGGPISWHRLAAETRDAYLALLGALR